MLDRDAAVERSIRNNRLNLGSGYERPTRFDSPTSNVAGA